MKELLVLLVVIWHSSAQDLLVDLPNAGGKVLGATLISPNGRQYYTWRKIPYAKPPVGDLRFQPPERPEPWTEVRDGSIDAPACNSGGLYDGDPTPTHGYSEDCLYINVYSPILPPSSPNSSVSLPVMFYIYGGGFITGTGDFAFYDPTPFMEEDVIIVTFNYRLAVFGFLSLEDETTPGNYGLKDQLAALIWTRENIAWFGGNPLDITIFGESVGGMAVGYHLASPRSRNLFTKAIMQSGSALCDFQQRDARNNAITLANQIESSISNSSSSEEILAVLKNIDSENLTKLAIHSGINFRPVYEVDNPGFFSMDPYYELYESGNFTQVPVIIGTNSDEGLVNVKNVQGAEETAAYYDSNIDLLLPPMNLKDGINQETISEDIKNAYVGNGTFSKDPGAIIKWMGDNIFVRPVLKQAILQSKYAPVYFYEFSYVGAPSKNRPDLPGCGKVAHADDVDYLFNVSTKLIEGDKDYLVRKRFVKLWTNFAKTKNPTPGDDSSALLQNVTWEQFNAENLRYLEIGDDLKLRIGREAELMEFWDNLWSKYAARPYRNF